MGNADTLLGTLPSVPPPPSDGDFSITILHEPAEPLPKKDHAHAHAAEGALGADGKKRSASNASGKMGGTARLKTANKITGGWGGGRGGWDGGHGGGGRRGVSRGRGV